MRISFFKQIYWKQKRRYLQIMKLKKWTTASRRHGALGEIKNSNQNCPKVAPGYFPIIQHCKLSIQFVTHCKYFSLCGFFISFLFSLIVLFFKVLNEIISYVMINIVRTNLTYSKCLYKGWCIQVQSFSPSSSFIQGTERLISTCGLQPQ